MATPLAAEAAASRVTLVPAERRPGGGDATAVVGGGVVHRDVTPVL